MSATSNSAFIYVGGFIGVVVTAVIVVATLSSDELDSPRQKLVLLSMPQAPPAPPVPPPAPHTPPQSPNAPPSPPAGRRLEQIAAVMRRPASVIWTGS